MGMKNRKQRPVAKASDITKSSRLFQPRALEKSFALFNFIVHILDYMIEDNWTTIM